MTRENWTFSSYLEEIFSLSAVQEIDGIKATIAELIKEMWKRYPEECEAIGLEDGLEE